MAIPEINIAKKFDNENFVKDKDTRIIILK